MKTRIKGNAVYDQGASRGYQIGYRCPADGTVTIYFDYLVHKIDEDCSAKMRIVPGDQYGTQILEDRDSRFDNKNFRWNPTLTVFKDQAISFYIGIELHNAIPSKPWEFVLDFDDGQ
jgi:hypothetical protein